MLLKTLYSFSFRSFVHIISTFRFTTTAAQKKYTPSRIWHIRGLSVKTKPPQHHDGVRKWKRKRELNFRLWEFDEFFALDTVIEESQYIWPGSAAKQREDWKIIHQTHTPHRKSVNKQSGKIQLVCCEVVVEVTPREREKDMTINWQLRRIHNDTLSSHRRA